MLSAGAPESQEAEGSQEATSSVDEGTVGGKRAKPKQPDHPEQQQKRAKKLRPVRFKQRIVNQRVAFLFCKNCRFGSYFEHNSIVNQIIATRRAIDRRHLWHNLAHRDKKGRSKHLGGNPLLAILSCGSFFKSDRHISRHLGPRALTPKCW